MSQSVVRDLHFIEDSTDEIFLSKMLLENEKVKLKLHHHYTLREFRQYLLEHPKVRADLLLVDLNLPVNKGTVLIRELAHDVNAPDVITGICTGSDDPKDRLDALESGADFFVNKPLNLKCLQTICESVGTLSLKVNQKGEVTVFRESDE